MRWLDTVAAMISFGRDSWGMYSFECITLDCVLSRMREPPHTRLYLARQLNLPYCRRQMTVGNLPSLAGRGFHDFASELEIPLLLLEWRNGIGGDPFFL